MLDLLTKTVYSSFIFVFPQIVFASNSVIIKDSIKESFKKFQEDSSYILSVQNKEYSVRKCPSSLNVDTSAFSRLGKYKRVKVSCPSIGWSIYVPISIGRHVESTFTTNPINKNDLLTERNTMVKEVLVYDSKYRTRLDYSKKNRALKFYAPNQEVLGTKVAFAKDIEKGQSLKIISIFPGGKIEMNGVSLTSGNIGDRIKARNISSDKVVQGILKTRYELEVN